MQQPWLIIRPRHLPRSLRIDQRHPLVMLLTVLAALIYGLAWRGGDLPNRLILMGRRVARQRGLLLLTALALASSPVTAGTICRSVTVRSCGSRFS